MSDPSSKKPRTDSPQTALEAALSDKNGAVLRHALWLETLNQQLSPLLPLAIADHCRLANVTSERLVFVADSPIWRAKLRLVEKELINAAHSLGLTATRLIVKTCGTTPNTHDDHPRPSSGRPAMSASTQAALRQALASLQLPPSRK